MAYSMVLNRLVCCIMLILLSTSFIRVDIFSSTEISTTSGSHCAKQNKLNMECYYEPWTHCSLMDAMRDIPPAMRDIRRVASSSHFNYDAVNTYKPEALIAGNHQERVVKLQHAYMDVRILFVLSFDPCVT